jgi:hypothetical protein
MQLPADEWGARNEGLTAEVVIAKNDLHNPVPAHLSGRAGLVVEEKGRTFGLEKQEYHWER